MSDNIPIRITHAEDWPNVSDAKWRKHLDKEERRAARTRYEPQAPSVVVDEPTAAPPAPRVEVRPPSPGVRAEWIPGYWHWSRRWLWISGHWQLPALEARATAAAPFAPPPPRAEPAPAPAGIDVMWNPGYWAWDGRIYVWITGGWSLR